MAAAAGRADVACWGGSEEFCGIFPFAGRSNSSIFPLSSAISASSTRMIACASGGWRAIPSSVSPGGMPLLLPNAALYVQVSSSKIVSRGLSDYPHVLVIVAVALSARIDPFFSIYRFRLGQCERRGR